MLTEFEPTPNCTAVITPYDLNQRAVIKELHLELSAESPNRSDITRLVRFSSKRLCTLHIAFQLFYLLSQPAGLDHKLV